MSECYLTYFKLWCNCELKWCSMTKYCNEMQSINVCERRAGVGDVWGVVNDTKTLYSSQNCCCCCCYCRCCCWSNGNCCCGMRIWASNTVTFCIDKHSSKDLVFVLLQMMFGSNSKKIVLQDQVAKLSLGENCELDRVRFRCGSQLWARPGSIHPGRQLWLESNCNARPGSIPLWESIVKLVGSWDVICHSSEHKTY